MTDLQHTPLTDAQIDRILDLHQEHTQPFYVLALVHEVRRLRAAVAEVDAIERWPYNPGTMQGFELDHAQGYNDALTEVRRALHPEEPRHD